MQYKTYYTILWVVLLFFVCATVATPYVIAPWLCRKQPDFAVFVGILLMLVGIFFIVLSVVEIVNVIKEVRFINESEAALEAATKEATKGKKGNGKSPQEKRDIDEICRALGNNPRHHKSKSKGKNKSKNNEK